MNVLITGANRGIGLGLVGYYLANGDRVFACSRNPDGARELWEYERDFGDRCRIVQLDVTNEQDIAALPKALGDNAIDLLINNAGILPEQDASLRELTANNLLKTLRVNLIGPMAVTQVLLPSLSRSMGPVVVNVTSKLGSLADNGSGGNYAYRISKTALNMLNLNMAREFKDMICLSLHTGWVETDMGGPQAPVSVDASVAGIARVIKGLTLKDSGRFLDFQGHEIAW